MWCVGMPLQALPECGGAVFCAFSRHAVHRAKRGAAHLRDKPFREKQCELAVFWNE